MFSITKNPGVDLPIITQEEFYAEWSEPDTVTSRVPDTRKTFIRHIDVGGKIGSIEGSLMQLLRISDEVFTNVAGLCGATVVKHDWLLRRLDDEGYQGDCRIPIGHKLVARVGILDTIDFDKASQLKVHNGIKAHFENPGDYIWTDAFIEQFSKGYSRTEDDTTAKLWLHDIDLRIRKS